MEVSVDRSQQGVCAEGSSSLLRCTRPPINNIQDEMRIRGNRKQVEPDPTPMEERPQRRSKGGKHDRLAAPSEHKSGTSSGPLKLRISVTDMIAIIGKETFTKELPITIGEAVLSNRHSICGQ